MKKQLMTLILSGAMVISTMAGFASTVAAEEEEWPEMKLTYATFSPEDSYNGHHAKVFMDEIEKRTDGKITFDRYFNGTLYSGPELYNAVTDGSVDMVTTFWLYNPGQTPMYQLVLSPPFTVTDDNTATEIAREFAAEEPAFQEEAEKEGYHVLANTSTQGYFIIAKGDIQSWKDLNGRKLNFGGVYYAPMMEVAGVAQVSGTAPDFYQSVKTGVSSGIFLDSANSALYKYNEVTDCIYECELGARCTGALILNKSVYDSMDPKVQKLFDEVGLYAEQEHLEWYENEQEPKDEEILSDLPRTAITPEDKAEWAAAIQNNENDPIEMWIQTADEAGYDGKAIMQHYLTFVESKGHEWPFDTSKYF